MRPRQSWRRAATAAGRNNGNSIANDRKDHGAAIVVAYLRKIDGNARCARTPSVLK